NVCSCYKENHFIFRSLQGLANTLHEGHVASKHELHTLLQHTVSQDSRSVILFLQDTLSVDDFTRYANSSGNETPFRNVQELLKTSSSSLVLPAVDHHAVDHLSEYFQQILNWTVVNVDDPHISPLMMNASKPQIFVIMLQPVQRINELSALKGLMENDKIIERFAKALQQHGIQYLAIYTARRPSKIPVEFGVGWHSRRQLMSVQQSDIKEQYRPVKVTNGSQTCILFYATEFNFTAGSQPTIILTNSTFVFPNVDTSLSQCSETSANLSLRYNNQGNIKDLEIRFIMNNRFYEGSARKWFTLEHILIIADNRSVDFSVTDISSPAEFSFHCQKVGTSKNFDVTLNPDDNKEHWEVVISEFQIQAFNVANNTFSYASDCTSFFTPAIWMGLVTSLVLLLILTYGIHMIVHLTTNSRFDDPKGPALSVPETE
ncbi:V-type proton ATPase subunit S1-like, partial [Hemicordylus capensis]|uniref:V-type proton ATPase subunit S1-like n=1 Tax=Hemicordylus capensis TaxID=884348 RepID=UPI00230371D1